MGCTKRKLTKKEKEKLYAPQTWALYENGRFVTTYESHRKAKTAKYFKNKEADADMLDLSYEIRPYVSKIL